MAGPTLLDPEGRLAAELRVSGTGEVAVLDRGGRLVAVLPLPASSDALDAALTCALDGSCPALPPPMICGTERGCW